MMSFFDEKAINAAAIARLAQIHRMTTEDGGESEAVRARWEEMSEEDRETFRGMVRPILDAAITSIDLNELYKKLSQALVIGHGEAAWMLADHQADHALHSIGLHREVEP